jgi:hypothetical protein
MPARIWATSTGPLADAPATPELVRSRHLLFLFFYLQTRKFLGLLLDLQFHLKKTLTLSLAKLFDVLLCSGAFPCLFVLAHALP